MNTHAFYFHLRGDGRWMMEAEQILEGEVSPTEALADYFSGELIPPSSRVFLLPTAEPAGYKVLH